MNLLLDTHAAIWALGMPRRLPRRAANALIDPENVIYISAASTWEIAIKSALGKIDADLEEIASGQGRPVSASFRFGFGTRSGCARCLPTTVTRSIAC